jgi:hypothetical protein
MINPLLKLPSALRTVVPTAALLALASGVAQAHPGHGLHAAGAAHLLTSPYHLAVLALGGATIWVAARWVERRLPRRLLQLFGVVAVAAATVLMVLRA